MLRRDHETMWLGDGPYLYMFSFLQLASTGLLYFLKFVTQITGISTVPWGYHFICQYIRLFFFFLIFKNKSSFKKFYPGNNKYYSGFNETGFLPCGVEKLAWINTLWSCWDLCRGGRAGGRITASFLCSSTTGSCSAPGRNWALCLKGLSGLGKKERKKKKTPGKKWAGTIFSK